MIKTSVFIKKFTKRFGMDYALDINPESIECIYEDDIIRVECPEHGVFEGTYEQLLDGYGCPKCGVQRLIKNYTVAKHLSKHKYLIESEYKEEGDKMILVRKKKTTVPIMLYAPDISGIPDAIKVSFEFATNDPYVTTWDDWRRVFMCSFNSYVWHEGHVKEETTNATKKKTIGCKTMTEVYNTVARIKKIRENKNNNKQNNN